MSVGPLVSTSLAAVGTRLRVEELTLSTHEGPPGTLVSVTGTGFDVCGQATLTFDGQHATPAEVHIPKISGTIKVPQDATVGPHHTIEAACDSGNAYQADDEFTVTSGGGTTTDEHQTLTLDPDHGSVGTPVNVQGKGFAQCSAKTVDLYVLNGPAIASAIPVTENGDFSYKEVVPDPTPPDTYTFRAACTGEPDVYADAYLVVESPANPVLSLDPEQGETNATLKATGTGFRCPNVDFLWDGGESPFASAAVKEPDSFTTEITVPADAQPGKHMVRAVCAAYPEQYDDSAFTVTANDGTDNGGTDNGGTDNGGTDNGGTDNGGTDNGGTDNGGTDNGSTDNGGTDNGGTGGGGGGGDQSVAVGWVVGPASLGAALLLAIAAAAYFGRLHRGPRWVRGHVRATLRPAPATADLTEPHPSGEGPTRTVRLDPHADPGSAAIEETDR
ncbi:hypothetical protein [Streptomyces sp. TLI_146]|uniref:hypothetical protein n=1 Tax=Streptomyces sp. TLI_146 TaxID=1938858 RepID=UPI000CC2F3B8|nr:hypothetical protein [Streptomyces sp. TLI_146]PKV83257.1 hypothetical protein BX283_0756 [Streptomyces sp. TLI_146]